MKFVFMQRRKLLHTMGIGVVTMGSAVTTSQAASESKPEEIWKESLRIRSEKGTEAAEDFLADNGFRTGSNQFESSVNLGGNENNEKNAGGDLKPHSIQDPQSGGITVELFGGQNSYTNDLYAGVSVDYKFIVDCLPGLAGIDEVSSGWEPKDAIGIAWNSYQNEYFNLADGGGSRAMTEGLNTEWHEDLHDPSRGRTVFRADDRSAFDDWWSDQTPCYRETAEEEVRGAVCSLSLEPKGDFEPEERVITAAYTHSYQEAEILSPSLGFSGTGPAVTFSPSYRINEDKVKTSDDGTDIEISQADLT